MNLTETNPAWAPIAPELDPIEATLRTIWSYARRPVRVSRTQRYRLAATEPALPSVTR